MSTSDQLTTYGELAEVIDHLPILVRERRRQQRLSMRAAAREIGVAASTVVRVESGVGADSSTLGALLRWLDKPVALDRPKEPT